MLLASCYLCILAAMAGGPFVARNGRMYRSVLGDPGMRWAQKGKGISETPKRPVGPRMQLFFYSLCSKAMPANFTVIPRASDTCSAPLVGRVIGLGEVERANSTDCCKDCLSRPWCLAWTEVEPGLCAFKDNTLPEGIVPTGMLETPQSAPIVWQRRSSVRVFQPDQRAPAPRYANCIVDGQQVVTPADNAAQTPLGVDEEWFAVLKEQSLGELCKEPAPPHEHRPLLATATPSYFWTVMSQNGNALANLGADGSCLPQCYHEADSTRAAGWPPAVNASASLCQTPVLLAEHSDSPTPRTTRHRFNHLPMNQAKVMVDYTQPTTLHGRFNWTYDLDSDLAVGEGSFPLDRSLGVWEWWYDEKRQKGLTRGLLRRPTQRTDAPAAARSLLCLTHPC